MRKFMLIFMLAAAFGLGMVSRNLPAEGLWEIAPIGTWAPKLQADELIVVRPEGLVEYNNYSNCKAYEAGINSRGQVYVKWKIKEGYHQH